MSSGHVGRDSHEHGCQIDESHCQDWEPALDPPPHVMVVVVVVTDRPALDPQIWWC